MNRTKMVNIIAQQTGESSRLIQMIIDSYSNIISETLADGDSVSIKGLGTFNLKDVAATRIRNIATNETMDIPSRKRLKFTPSTEMRNKLKRTKSIPDVISC